jgi:hypothetical protein
MNHPDGGACFSVQPLSLKRDAQVYYKLDIEKIRKKELGKSLQMNRDKP